jgi:hypothetical protein
MGDADCNAILPGSLCFRLSDTLSVCFESCTVGAAGDPECHGRAEFACQGYTTIGTTRACTDDGDCENSEFCGDDGACQEVLTACLPACGGDFHCDDARCDERSGFCTSESPSGLPTGALCDPDDADDPCAGLCVRFSAEAGMCSSICNTSATASCGFNPDASEPASAACLWPALYADASDLGGADPGFCGPLCDCAEDCTFADWTCLDGGAEFTSGFADIFGRAGFCAPPNTGRPESRIQTCGGGGGAGGQSGG